MHQEITKSFNAVLLESKEKEEGEEEEGRRSLVSDNYDSQSAAVVLVHYINKALELPLMDDSLVRKASNKVEFDYRHLRFPDNAPHYESVSTILEGEATTLMVYTDLVKISISSAPGSAELQDPSLMADSPVDEWMVIVITSTLIHMLDADSQFRDAKQLIEIAKIVLIDENPSLLALVFRAGSRVVVESHRRVEIVAYILSQKDQERELCPAVERVKSLESLEHIN